MYFWWFRYFQITSPVIELWPWPWPVTPSKTRYFANTSCYWFTRSEIHVLEVLGQFKKIEWGHEQLCSYGPFSPLTCRPFRSYNIFCIMYLYLNLLFKVWMDNFHLMRCISQGHCEVIVVYNNRNRDLQM